MMPSTLEAHTLRSAAAESDRRTWTDGGLAPTTSYLGPEDALSPLSDFSPLTLFPSPSGYNTQVCLVLKGDTLTFYVTNPEYTGSGAASLAVCVGTSGVAPPTCPT
jgi:hypothetical protein